MNTAQIKTALNSDSTSRKKFCGVFPADHLPETLDSYPCGIIANTDPSSEPGTHWVAFYFPSKEKGEFFDSYGQSPRRYRKTFENFLEKQSYEWEFNTHKLQSAWSNVCGQYCIFYISHRIRGHSMKNIVQLFSNDTMLNDARVSQFVKNHFNIMLNRSNFVNFNNQISKKKFK